MKWSVRGALASALAAGALWQLAAVAPEARDVLRARGAETTFCGPGLASRPRGTVVRLSRCGVDMFHVAFLDDPQRRWTHRLVPLRAAGDSAADPGPLALAIPFDALADAEGFRIRHGEHSAQSQIADLDEVLAVVRGPAGAVPAVIRAVPGIESGLSENPTVVEIVVPPAPGHFKRPLIIAGALLLFAILLALWPARTAGEPGAPPVRWGLVFVTVLVGIVALARGLQWYLDPQRQTTGPAASVPPPSVPPEATGVRLEPATAEELSLLTSADAGNRKSAAIGLQSRAISPELEAAVNDALQKEGDPAIRTELICVKARFTGAGSLDYLIASLPVDPIRFSGSVPRDVLCLLDTLVRRIEEAPERITAALLPVAYSNNHSIRGRVLEAFRRIDVPVPASLAADAASPGHRYRREALAAAMALGAARKNPDLVAMALADDQLRPIVVAEPTLRR